MCEDITAVVDHRLQEMVAARSPKSFQDSFTGPRAIDGRSTETLSGDYFKATMSASKADSFEARSATST